jgi:hypothetical protein
MGCETNEHLENAIDCTSSSGKLCDSHISVLFEVYIPRKILYFLHSNSLLYNFGLEANAPLLLLAPFLIIVLLQLNVTLSTVTFYLLTNCTTGFRTNY